MLRARDNRKNPQVRYQYFLKVLIIIGVVVLLSFVSFFCFRAVVRALRWDRMRWDGIGWEWDGMGWDGMGWDNQCLIERCAPIQEEGKGLCEDLEQ